MADTIDTRPIYVYTYYFQRMNFPPLYIGDPEPAPGGPRPEKGGYRSVPGCTLEVWFYNTTSGKWAKAKDFRSGAETDQEANYEAMQFWQPSEYMSHKARALCCDLGGDWAGTDGGDQKLGDMNSREDIVKIKFINDNKMPVGSDGNPSPCGMFASASTDSAIWDPLAILGGH